MEQNAAFAYVRNICAAENIPLQKQGIKNDHQGKYIELTFLSPELGARYEKQITALSADTGWRMVISRAVLQNQVLPLAAQIAERAGFTLVKSPSYMPVTREIQLKVSSFNPDAQASVISEITEQTGLSCKILIM